MLNTEEWQEYKAYLSNLSAKELEIELQWLESVGLAKSRGSTVTSNENFTIQ